MVNAADLVVSRGHEILNLGLEAIQLVSSSYHAKII